MPRKEIREARKEARVRRQVEDELQAEEAILIEEKEKRILARLNMTKASPVSDNENVSHELAAPNNLIEQQQYSNEPEMYEQQMIEQTVEEPIGQTTNAELSMDLAEQQSIHAPDVLKSPSKESDDLKWNATDVAIQAGAAQEIFVNAKVGDILEYTFHTEGGDIAFGVLSEAANGITDVVVEKQRLDAHENPIKGTVKCIQNGKLWLQWDNSYSWLTNKQLQYSLILHPAVDTTIPTVQDFETEQIHRAQNVPLPKFTQEISILFVIGGPGAGKGTQCARLAEAMSLGHLPMRNMLETYEIKDHDSKVADAAAVVHTYINTMYEKSTTFSTFLIDGFPANEIHLNEWLRETSYDDKIKVQGVLLFDCPESIVEQRLVEHAKRAQATSTYVESVRTRFEEFRKDSSPVIDYFNKRGQLWTIHAERSPEQVYQELSSLVVKMIPSQMRRSLSAQSNQSQSIENTEDTQNEPSPIMNSTPRKTENGVTTPHGKTAMRIILGTMTFANQVSNHDAEIILEQFLNSKVVRRRPTGNKYEIDTARMYQRGKTESCIGSILLNRRDLANQLVVASKANPFPGYNENLRPDNVLSQARESLDALHRKTLDIFYLHSPDHHTNLESTLEAVQHLYEQGLIRELGLSNYPAWQVVHIYYICKAHGWILPTVYQGMYNVLTRDVEVELLPALRELNIRFYAYNPLAGGLLTGKHPSYTKMAGSGRFSSNAAYQDRFWKPEYFVALDTMKASCAKFGIPLAEASIRWMVHHSKLNASLNDGIIVGVSSLDHLLSNLDAAGKDVLPPELVSVFNHAWNTCKPVCPCYHR